MLSKNNHKLQLQKLGPTKQHFTIKKFTVGVASVLISSTFALYVSTQSQYVQADNAGVQTSEQHNKENAQTDLPSEKESSSQVLTGKQTTSSATDKNKVVETETKKADQAPASQTTPAKSAVAQTGATAVSQPEKQTAQATPAKAQTSATTVTTNSQSQAKPATSTPSSQAQAKPATGTSSSQAQTKPQTAPSSQSQAKPAETVTTPATTVPVAQDHQASHAANVQTKPETSQPHAETAQATTTPQAQGTPVVPTVNKDQSVATGSTNSDQSETETNSQWSADAQKAVANKSGLYTPQLGFNDKWYTMAFDPGMLTNDVLTGNTIPFTVVNHRSLASAASSPAYKLRVQFDNRLADKVNKVSVSVAGEESKVVNFTRVVGDDNKPTNMWEANMIYSRGGIFGGGFMNSGASQIAKNGKITLVDTVQNVLRQIPDATKQPLVYNAYAYDDTSHTALLSTNNSGYIVGPGNPLVKVPVSTPDESKFNGAHSVVTYDPTIGKNGALVVFYQANKSYMWAYDNDWRLQFNYAIDPALLPYLEKVNGARTVELDMLTGNILPVTDGAYGFEKQYDKQTAKWVWKPLAYDSSLTKKVADLPFNDDGTGKLNPTNLGEYIDFQNGALYHGRPASLRLVYRLNKKPSDIYVDLLKKGNTNGNLLFSEYYSTQDGTMQAYSLATGFVSFNDSDGDGLPDVKENTESTNPFVSMPNVSNVYGTEQKVHGQLVFSNIEKNPQKLTVTDKDGKVLGTTTVTPVKFNGLAQAQPFTVALDSKVNNNNGNLSVAVAPVLDTSDEIDDNTVPQVTLVTVKTAPVGVTGKEYPLNASFLEEPNTLIANAAQLPADTKYSWVKKPDLTKSGDQQAAVKVSFADKYDPTYQHELVVPVSVKVVGVDLKDGTFKVKDVVMHVNESSNTVPLTPEVLLSWTSKDGKKTLTGETLWSLVKGVSWGESPVTNVAGKTTGFVSVATKDNEEILASVNVDVVGAKAKSALMVPWGQQLDASDAVANTAQLEQFSPVTYAWKSPLQVTPQPSENHTLQAEVVVTYGDHTTQLLPVTVQVEPSEAEAFNEDQNVKFQPVIVGLKENVVADKALASLVPTEQKSLQVVKAVFKDKVDTTKVGEKQVPATLTFVDGSTTVANVPVKVVSQAQSYDPTVKKNLQVNLGENLDPDSVLNPDVTLPQGTKVTWKVPVDTNKAGTQTGEVEVAYPDSSTDELPVQVKVGTDADVVTPKVKTNLQSALNGNLAPESVLDPSVALPQGTKVTWKVPVDTTKAGKQTGTLEVTYPDNSKDELPVQVKVGTDAQAVTPKVKANVHADLNKSLAPESVLDPSVVLPQGTKVTWKTPVDTAKAGKQTGEVEVTYPDGSKDEVPVQVKVGTDADAVTPKVKANVQTDLNKALAPESVLDPSVALPTGTKVTWKTPVDTAKAGKQTGEVEVTYPDGSKDELPVQVKVGTDAEAVTPKVKANVQTDLNKALAPESVLDPSVTLPQGTKVTWKTPVDTTKAGSQTGTLEVTYPDGSKDELPVQVKVGSDADAVTPKLKVNPQVSLGGKLAPESVLDPSVVLPQGTKVTWKTPVDTTKAGSQTGTLEVTYPDGSKDELPVKVKVGTDADAVAPKLKANPQVSLGDKLAPESVLDPSVTLPQGTKVTWKSPVDTTKAGKQAGTLEVTYPDGSKDELPVQVKVGTDADAVAPKVKDNVQTALNSNLTPESMLDPSVALPQGTKVTWKLPVDTTKAGMQTGTLEVTYPDGSKEDLPAQVKVGTDAQAVILKARNNVHTDLNKELAPDTVIDSSVNLPQGTKVTWKTPVDTTKAGSQTGVLEVTYPDGSKVELPVQVKVGTDAQAVTPKVKANVHTDLNKALAPESVLDSSVALPQGTKVTWKSPVDTSKVGTQTGTLEVTYPDGSKEELPVQVKVGTDAQAVTPKVKANVHTDLNKSLAPESVLDSSVALPQGTKVTWKSPVDTTKAGMQTGTLEVTYPDGSKEELAVKVKVGTDAQAVTPKVKANVQTDLNKALAPESVLDPSVTLPQGTKVTWKTPVDTSKAGTQTGTLEVTYPDGSKEELSVQVKVGSDADAVTPKLKVNPQVSLGGKLAPESVLDPSVALPQGTKVTWKTPVDTSKAGTQTGTLEVTYPDDSKEELSVQVKVGSDADAVTPKLKVNPQVSLGGKLAPESVLDPSVVLPQGTKVTWKTPVDTTKAGSQTGTLEVTYPDGSKDELPVKVKVGTDDQAVTPKVKANVHVDLNKALAPESVLDPSVTLPQGTKVTWKTPVDTSKAGTQTGTLEVTYPDGSKEELSVQVKVGSDADAVMLKLKVNPQVSLGGKLAPESVLDPSVTLPQGTKVTWKTPVDTTKTGMQTGTLEVTYPDGSKEELSVQVKVGTDAQAVTPKAKANVHVALNKVLAPESVLDSSVVLPQGTKVTWKNSVDTTKAGSQTGTLEVMYPDGSKDELQVTVVVDGVTKENVETSASSLNGKQNTLSNSQNDQETNLDHEHENADKNVANQHSHATLNEDQKGLSFKQSGQKSTTLKRKHENVGNNHKQVTLNEKHSQGTKKALAKVAKTSTELPQTGEKNSTGLTLLGLVGALLGLFGLTEATKDKSKKF